MAETSEAAKVQPIRASEPKPKPAPKVGGFPWGKATLWCLGGLAGWAVLSGLSSLGIHALLAILIVVIVLK